MNESLGAINLIVLIIPAAALYWGTQLVYGERGAASDDTLKRVLVAGSVLLFLVGFLGIIDCLTAAFAHVTAHFVLSFVLPPQGFGPPPPLVPLVGNLLRFPFAVAAICPIFLPMIRAYRRAEFRTLLDMLAIAAERGLPLDGAARAFADERSDELGLRANRLADLLSGGTPLTTALSSSGLGYLPSDAALAVHVGCETGLLALALRRIMGMGPSLEAALRTLNVKCLYLVMLFVNLALFLCLTTLHIFPRFKRMYDEFELRLPTPTQWLTSTFTLDSPYTWLAVAFGILSAVVALAALLFYLGWLPRWLPVVSWLTRRYDGALVMRALALAVNQERSLVETIRLLAWHYPLKTVRRRLALAVWKIDQGADWCDSLVSQGLVGRSESAVLKAAQRVGNLEWALGEMADASVRRTAYRWQTVLNILGPLMILAVGMAVAFVGISILMPLFALIMGLSK